MIGFLAFFMLALLGGPDADPAQTDPAIRLTFAYRGERCIVRLENRKYRLPEDDERIESHFAELKARHIGVILDPGSEYSATPWRCVGGVLFLAQRLQMRIGFISAPPDRQARVGFISAPPDEDAPPGN